jgi:deoxyribose-phosphate aldolase
MCRWFSIRCHGYFLKLMNAEAVRNGADEIDMVINIGFLKDLKYELVEDEIRQIKKQSAIRF